MSNYVLIQTEMCQASKANLDLKACNISAIGKNFMILLPVEKENNIKLSPFLKRFVIVCYDGNKVLFPTT